MIVVLLKIATAYLLMQQLLSGTDLPEELSRRSRAYLKSQSNMDHDGLISFAEKSTSSTKALALLAAGMGDRAAKKYKEAATHLAIAMEGLEDLAHYAAYYQLHSLAMAEDHTAAIMAATQFLQLFPHSRFVGMAKHINAKSLIQNGQRNEARRLLESSYEAMPEPLRLYELARLTHLDGKPLEAIRTYRRVYYHYPFSDQAEKSEIHLNTLRKKLGANYPEAPPKWRLGRAEALLKSRKFAQASAEYTRAAVGLSGNDLEQALVHRGTADYKRNYTSKTYQHLKRLKIKDPDLDAERVYLISECARRLQKIKEFQDRVEHLAETYPNSKWYESALFSLGNYYLLKKATTRSRNYYERAARTFPQGKYAARAHWKVCWRAYLDRDPKARLLFEEHVKLYPHSTSASGAIYWTGRLEEKENSSRAASLYMALTKHFPHYYYGYLARQRLQNISFPKLNPAESLLPISLTALPRVRKIARKTSAETKSLLRRGKILYKLGLVKQAITELRTGDYHKPDSPWIGLALAEQHSAQGRHHLGLRMMKRYGFGYLRMQFESMPREFWERLFPMPYEKSLRARSKPHKLDPYLMAALIRQESEFNPGAISSAGARGLMQIMPATGKRIAARLGIRGFRSRHLYRADTSLRFGTFHFRKIQDRFKHRIAYTLAAYNAGEHRVEEWMTRENFKDLEEFTETIPFTETRGYVQSVFRNAQIYRALYGKTK